MTRKTVTEKRELLRMYKCKRQSELLMIIAELEEAKHALINPILTEIACVEAKLSELEAKKHEMLVIAKLDQINTYSCGGSSHPRLKAFYAESYDYEMNLWANE